MPYSERIYVKKVLKAIEKEIKKSNKIYSKIAIGITINKEEGNIRMYLHEVGDIHMNTHIYAYISTSKVLPCRKGNVTIFQFYKQLKKYTKNL